MDETNESLAMTNAVSTVTSHMFQVHNTAGVEWTHKERHMEKGAKIAYTDRQKNVDYTFTARR